MQQHEHHQQSLCPPQAQGHFQLPQYARRGSFDPSPETVDAQSISRSPSPPPQPPSYNEEGENENQVSRPTNGSAERTVSLESDSSKPKAAATIALGERGNNAEVAPVVAATGMPTASKPKSEDPTADAASILLQLSSVVKKDGTEVENENPNQETRPTTHVEMVKGSASMDEVSEATLPDHNDSAPDLTSEPSMDSADHQHQHRPTESDFPCPVPDRYPTRLSLPYDGSKLNSLHCFLRSELLEIFVVQKSANKSPTHSPHSSIGRVGLRCVHCAMNPRQKDDREEAPMAVFYPKSIAEIYRLVTSWQRCHLRKCRNLPPPVRSKWQELRENDKSRGKTHYWVTSAKQIGLMDCQSRAGGIRFAPDFDASKLPSESRLVSATNEEDMDAEESQTTPKQAPQTDEAIEGGVSKSETMETDEKEVTATKVPQTKLAHDSNVPNVESMQVEEKQTAPTVAPPTNEASEMGKDVKAQIEGSSSADSSTTAKPQDGVEKPADECVVKDTDTVSKQMETDCQS